MTEANTVWNLLAAGADNAPAIGAPEREALDFAGLRTLAQKTVADLNALGIGRDDRVAIVLPNGPEMATAFMAIACGATTAPLNPDYKAEEFAFYLSDLNAKALIVEAGSTSPAIQVAHDKNVPVYEIVVPSGAPAGSFEISAAKVATGKPQHPGMAGPEDIALVLHT